MSQRNERSAQTHASRMSHWLIHHAAHRAPETLSSRLEEEWLADLESRSSALSRLRLAAGCCWATWVIVHEPSRGRVAAASASVSAGGLVTLADRNFGYFSLRSATLFLIAGLHAALFYGLVTTLSHTRGSTIPPDLQNTVVDPVPPTPVPPSPGTEVKDWTIHVQKPVLDVPRKIDVESDVTAHLDEKSVEPYSPPLVPQSPTHPRVASGRGTRRWVSRNGGLLPLAVDSSGGRGNFHRTRLRRCKRQTYRRAVHCDEQRKRAT